MSTFPGPIAELPGVSADNFVTSQNGESGCFFLSHCHTDHMAGLESSSFRFLLQQNPGFYVYCSPVSRLILSTKSFLSPIMNQVRDLKIGLNSLSVPICPGNVIEYPMTVTLIPAGHCPGSVMFLFETSSTTVLYTGDFRIAEGDVSKFKQFHYGGRVKKIDAVYLDTTFFSKSYWQFVSRDRSIQVMIELIATWLNKYSGNHVKIKMPAFYGGEHILEKVARTLNCRIHVIPEIYEMYLSVPEMRGIFTNRCGESRIHVHNRTNNLRCVDNLPINNIMVLNPKAATFQCMMQDKPDEYRDRVSGDLDVNYSSHSSYSEIVNFLKYLKPKKIYPCTDTFNTTSCEQEALIDELLSSWISSSPSPIPKSSPQKRTPEKRQATKLVITNSSHSIGDNDLDSPE